MIDQGIPIVIQQDVRDTMEFAVLAKKEVRIACTGCFHPSMRISDATRCKKCASFVRHWEKKDGVRRPLQCKEPNLTHEAAACEMVTLTPPRPPKEIKDIPDCDVLEGVKNRNLTDTLMTKNK